MPVAYAVHDEKRPPYTVQKAEMSSYMQSQGGTRQGSVGSVLVNVSQILFPLISKLGQNEKKPGLHSTGVEHGLTGTTSGETKPLGEISSVGVGSGWSISQRGVVVRPTLTLVCAVSVVARRKPARDGDASKLRIKYVRKNPTKIKRVMLGIFIDG